MKKIYFYIFVSILLCVSISSYAQNSYFFNQKNLISIHASMNPRLMPMSHDNEYVDEFSSSDGIHRGTFYQRYNEDNELVGGNEKINLMLNTSYGRLFGGHHIIGVEFNYQKHFLTMNENSNMGYTYVDDYNTDPEMKPFLFSSPVFNVYDFQLFYGYFFTGAISPNKHLITFGGGVRIFSLDQDQNYRKNSETPFTDLSNFMTAYDQNIMFVRFSINYTYRILLTKNLSFDIGFNTNLGLSFEMDAAQEYQPGDGAENGAVYKRSFIRNRLGTENFYNIFYLRTGLSFAI